MLVEGGFQLSEGLLRPGQIARVESLTDCVKVLCALAVIECASALEWAALAERFQSLVGLLRVREVAGSKILAELLDIGLALLIIRSQLLVNGFARSRV